MNIIVTVKKVPDSEAPAGAFGVSTDNSVLISPNVANVISPYDESAIEAALQLRDTHGGKVTLVSYGTEADEDFLHEAMSTGADEAYFVVDDLFQLGGAFVTAYVLFKAIAKIGGYKLILCGRQASDTDAGVVGSVIAELLDLPSATVVRKIDYYSDGQIKAERVIEDGIEILEVSLPALLTMTSELYTLRYASVLDIMAAADKPVTIWNASDIGADVEEFGAKDDMCIVEKRYIPVSDTQCEFISGENIEEAATNLALALRNRKIV